MDQYLDTLAAGEYPTMYSGGHLDRLNNERAQTADSFLVDSRSHFILFSSSLRHVVLSSESESILSQPSESSQNTLSLVLLSKNNALLINQSTNLPSIFLGFSPDAVPICAVVSSLENNELEKQVQSQIPHAQLLELRSSASGIGSSLSHSHSSIAAHAKSLFEFHMRHRYCGVCGSQSIPQHGGSRRICSRHKELAPNQGSSDFCDGIFFPRSDPVVIAAILSKDRKRVLLGRGKHFPPGMYSALAGFMEHGESVEDAVRREVFEETGVRVGKVEYDSSQPWPYPYSLMIGCIGYVSERIDGKGEDLVIDKNELSDAQWVPIEHLEILLEESKSASTLSLVAKQKEMILPMPAAIAHQLVHKAVAIAQNRK